MVIHIVCLTQRAEEHVFDKKIEALQIGLGFLWISCKKMVDFPTKIIGYSEGEKGVSDSAWKLCIESWDDNRKSYEKKYIHICKLLTLGSVNDH